MTFSLQPLLTRLTAATAEIERLRADNAALLQALREIGASQGLALCHYKAAVIINVEHPGEALLQAHVAEINSLRSAARLVQESGALREKVLVEALGSRGWADCPECLGTGTLPRGVHKEVECGCRKELGL